MADTDKNGYLDEAEAKRSLFFRYVFKVMDRDGDGKLFEKEVLAYIDALDALVKHGAASVVSLDVADRSKGIFEMLDKDGDGRLSVREIRELPKLIKLLKRDREGAIARTDIPRLLQATIRRGSGPSSFGDQVFFLGSYSRRQTPLPERKAGPLWFRKMDRNRDGDVSRREFLGTEAEFKKIDTDGDGLISLQEAEAYDRLKRHDKQKKEK
jgi:Ca2+-binding EF-hand superfamily protein